MAGGQDQAGHAARTRARAGGQQGRRQGQAGRRASARDGGRRRAVMRFVDEDQGQRGQRGQSDAAPAAGRRQPAQAAGSREEWRCQREQRGIGACRAPAGSRFGKVRNSPSSSRNTTPAACTLSRVRVHAAAQTSAHASAAPAIRPACTPAWAARSAWAQAAPGHASRAHNAPVQRRVDAAAARAGGRRVRERGNSPSVN